MLTLYMVPRSATQEFNNVMSLAIFGEDFGHNWPKSQDRQLNLDFKKTILVQQPSFHTGMGSSPLTHHFNEEHNDTYCDLPSTFLLDEFAFKNPFINSKRTSHKARVK